MKFSHYKYLILSDLYRYNADVGFKNFISHVLFHAGYKYSFWMRTCKFLHAGKALKYTLLPVAMFILRHYEYKYGISVPFQTAIGSGFYIGHFGGIVVNKNCRIGKNCNISQGVTLGQANRGAKKGCPEIRDNVYIGPGAKVIGAISVGNDAVIGANCVVSTEIPDKGVVAGVPGKVISHDGSEGYVNRTDYDTVLL